MFLIEHLGNTHLRVTTGLTLNSYIFFFFFKEALGCYNEMVDTTDIVSRLSVLR